MVDMSRSEEEITPAVCFCEGMAIDNSEGTDTWQYKILERLCTGRTGIYETNGCGLETSLAMFTPDSYLTIILLARVYRKWLSCGSGRLRHEASWEAEMVR